MTRSVIGIDLSLTAPGLAVIHAPWGDEPPHAIATTLGGVPTEQVARGKLLKRSAVRVAVRASNLTDGDALVVMEALLLQSGTGKAPERAAFWWMVRAELEERGLQVVSIHPTSRRSIALDDEAREYYRELPKHQKGAGGKRAVLASVRRRWPGVVLPDDNAADALVCAEVGAHALGFANMPDGLSGAQKKSMANAIKAFSLNERENKQCP